MSNQHSVPMSTDEFERILDNEVPTRITLSEQRRFSHDSDDNYSLNNNTKIEPYFEQTGISQNPSSKKTYDDDDFDSDLDDAPKKKLTDAQSLAEFLRTTGPPEPRPKSPPPKKKKGTGLFKFGKKSKDDKKVKKEQTPQPEQNVKKHVPLTVAAGYFDEPMKQQPQVKNQQPSQRPNFNNQYGDFPQQQYVPDQAYPPRDPANIQGQIKQQQEVPEFGQRGPSLQTQKALPFPPDGNNSAKQQPVRYPPRQEQNMDLSFQNQQSGASEVIVPVRSLSMQAQTDYPNIYGGYNDGLGHDDMEDEMYSDEEDYELLEDQGFDEEMIRNTEYNALVDNSQIYTEETKPKGGRRVAFAQVDDEISNYEVSDEEDVEGSIEKTGLRPRGSYYPKPGMELENQLSDEIPMIKQRQSSLAYGPPPIEVTSASRSSSFAISAQVKNPGSGPIKQQSPQIPQVSLASQSPPLTTSVSKTPEIPLKQNDQQNSPPMNTSSLTSLSNVSSTLTSDQVANKPRVKKKIRHVQIQTRGAITKEGSCQTEFTEEKKKIDLEEEAIVINLKKDNANLSELNFELEKNLENFKIDLIEKDNALEDLKFEMEENRLKFDKLSAHAYKKIKELLMERQMLDMEVSTLREQLHTLQDAQSRQWLENDEDSFN
ncbi:hypothetical protein HDU92_003747 [Lobulomyces angularis]|nr:hypothetical protein HDU92_003747 [Lobulomyces angularis]